MLALPLLNQPDGTFQTATVDECESAATSIQLLDSNMIEAIQTRRWTEQATLQSRPAVNQIGLVQTTADPHDTSWLRLSERVGVGIDARSDVRRDDCEN